MSEFRPSSVDSRIALVGALRHANWEVAAVLITNYLSAASADWDTTFTWTAFIQWANDSAPESVNELYQEMLRMYEGDFVINGICALISGGYISRRDDDDDTTHLTVTSKFVDVMRRYASTPA